MAEIVLLASSGTVEGIERCLNSYFCSKSWRVDPVTLEARDEALGQELKKHLRIIKKTWPLPL